MHHHPQLFSNRDPRTLNSNGYQNINDTSIEQREYPEATQTTPLFSNRDPRTLNSDGCQNINDTSHHEQREYPEATRTSPPTHVHFTPTLRCPLYMGMVPHSTLTDVLEFEVGIVPP